MEVTAKTYSHKQESVVVLSLSTLNCIDHVDGLVNKDQIKKVAESHGFFTSSYQSSLLDLKGIEGYKSVTLVKLNNKNSVSVMQELADIKAQEQEVNFVFINQNASFAAQAVANFKLKGWNFDKYFTEESSKKASKVSKVFVDCIGCNNIEEELTKELAIADGILFASELMNEPANKLYPKTYTEEIKKLTNLGVEVEILDKKQLEELGMGCLLGVAQGSAKEPYVAIMKIFKGNKEDKPIAFVGKGVTFDTGGISLKPSWGMEDMKFDMGGSATVCGIMKSLALRNAKVNAVGIVGLVENMPSSTAIKPGDVVKAMNGKTVEVINTDAEGRLVLADILYYAYKNFSPKYIVDFATLTGAMITALGAERAGYFANSNELATELEQAGEERRELLWRMPLGEEYDKYLVSDYADYRNISKLASRPAGSVVAAKFLEQFVGDAKWAHIDIAGVAWSSKGKRTATSFGIKLVNDFLMKNHEQR